MISKARKLIRTLLTKRPRHAKRTWARKTLVVGPAQPVDGDSLASTAAVLATLRKKGLEAFTLPTLTMYSQIDWILSKEDVHPACHALMRDDFTTTSLQAAYDTLIAVWRPDEVVLVDGENSGFDTRGVKTFRIDHHVKADEGAIDNATGFIRQAPSAGCILIEDFGIVEPILAVSLLTDTFWFRQNQPAQAIRAMATLTENGLTDQLLTIYQKRMMVHKDSRILACMHQGDLRFALNGEVAFVVLKSNDPEIHRGVVGELGYFCHHMCVVRGDGYISFRTSCDKIDLRPLATRYGRGGHTGMAAGQIDVSDKAALDRLFQDFVQVVAPAEAAQPTKS